MNMKRFFSTLLAVILFTCVFAQIDQNDVTMVSYKHSCKDKRATVLLKNNTDENISSVCIKITYMDMSGNKLDSLWFDNTISIKPGKSQEMDVDAYRGSWGYHYYKSEGDPRRAYKIDCELRDYSTEETGWHGLSDYDDEPTGEVYCLSPHVFLWPLLLFFIIIFGIFAWLCWLLVKWITKGKSK